ncbi:MAG TPA: bifunctional diaminohydroxyphosphoribosylaminopyrimidine deaminase/5-amino-6-(5-phosphoribosylamino)uracil reductase RibD [Longimicrobiaceae bacterium]|nr:bifunctional diaminohydroxyphosphoribosylaminopyrimidine deaminase/5-amino-6-(5-phosphoribosylamino)uracil reductase RibD [Longimicrobiaceae bacterium]
MFEAAATPDDRSFMRRAIELAALGWGQVAPNPLVGAVVVRDGNIVGEGWHARYGGDHAEVMALRAAGEEARGATLYVTLEPCAHRGKTPPCVDAVLAAGIARVVYAVPDPNPDATGGGAVLTRAGVATTAGVEEQAARDLDPPFFRSYSEVGRVRPYVTLKLALSLDARIADLAGRSNWITGERAREEVHRQRAAHDAIAVGIGTVLRDDPLLTARGPIAPRQAPARIVFDRKLRIPMESRLVRSASEAPVIVVCDPAAPMARREELGRYGVGVLSAVDLADGLRMLRDQNIRSLYCEGGAQFATALLGTDSVDRLDLFYAPLLLGPDGLAAFGGIQSGPMDAVIRWRHTRTEVFGSDTLITLTR